MRGFGQRRCSYCGKHGGDYGRHTGPCLAPETLAALKAFVADNGVRWRAKLREAWTRGEPVLQEVRNMVGPTGLDRLKIVGSKATA